MLIKFIASFVAANFILQQQSISAGTFCDVSGDSWSYSETVDWTTHKRVITSNYCPNHYSVCQSESCAGQATLSMVQNVTFELPLYPDFLSEPIDTTCMNGALGIALNGVPIEGISAGISTCVEPSALGYSAVGRSSCPIKGENDGVLYCGDSVIKYGSVLDKCGGFADGSGTYRYIFSPVCLETQLRAQSYNETDSTGGTHSPQVGWALDGFPVYGPLGVDGIQMLPCDSVAGGALSPYCLDSCRGLRASLPAIDSFRYRYYLAGAHATGACSSTVRRIALKYPIFR